MVAIRRLTLAFSCGARSAFKLKEISYLRSMLSRRQLQALVGRDVELFNLSLYQVSVSYAP